MTEVIGVRFRDAGKVYTFDPAGNQLAKGTTVVVETAHGVETGTVARGNYEVEDELIVNPLKPILREANEADLRILANNREKEARAFQVCKEKIVRHGLDMKLVDVEYTFDGKKILFYFTSDGRVDFRELVKDLAGIFRTRIELRQIGVRDEAKKVGGLGICGRPLCCAQHLCEFQPVSIKMAKEQGLSLNPTKISGACGRLMCCLKYEQPAYDELLRITPKVGSFIDTKEGRGKVVEANLISGNLRVQLEENPESIPISVNRRDLQTDDREAGERSGRGNRRGRGRREKTDRKEQE